MRQDKAFIFKLRHEGRSYREIQKETGVSRGTLCGWFRNEEWSRHIAVTKTVQTNSSEHIRMMQAVRRKNLDTLYEAVEQEAIAEYVIFKKEPLFWAGLMAYAGEGDKRTRHLVRITNSEFYIHKIFLLFATTYLKVSLSNIRECLIIYPDHNETLCKEMWSNILGIPRSQFHKTQVIQGKEKVRRLQYGIGMSIISSTVLKKKMLAWLSLAQDERFDAVIV